ncbi:terminase large subunit domain-containing protein [Candidatus Poriferisocius sp.]|uniref:terminase large subunit domain-containing protein n=1 Tax=Candidatus Poriferisocius sp. TaxID=3101276 RepID=UPI003B522059
MRLSPKQAQIAAYGGSRHRWTITTGPVGSGKSEAALIGFALAQSRYGGAEFGILTKGHPQLASVLKGGLERILDLDLTPDSDGRMSVPGANGLPNTLIALVAQDKRAEPRLRSFNLCGMLLEELTTLPPSIVAAANARCRVGDAKLIGTTNPDGPLHPLKTTLIDNAADYDAQIIKTTLRDNPGLSPGYIASLKSFYSGHMYARMVEGEWSAATGLVYPRFYEASRGAPDEPMLVHDIAIDVGESSVTHALLIGRTATGVSWIVDELRIDHQLHGQLEPRELVAKIRRWATTYAPKVASIIVDPAALAVRQEFATQYQGSPTTVGKAMNDWDEGVAETNLWLDTRALKIWGARCPELLRELGQLVWDEDQSMIGKDIPVPSPDHGTDAMRYYCLTRAVHEFGGKKVWEAQRREFLERKR